MTSTRKPSSKKTPRSSGPTGPSYPAPIQDTALNAAQRKRALEEMSSTEGLDVLVVGGGVTGAGQRRRRSAAAGRRRASPPRWTGPRAR